MKKNSIILILSVLFSACSWMTSPDGSSSSFFTDYEELTQPEVKKRANPYEIKNFKVDYVLSKSVSLSWQINSAIYKYKVFRSDKNNEYSAVSEFLSNYAESFTDQVNPGEEYSYRIKGFDKNDNIVFVSEQVDVRSLYKPQAFQAVGTQNKTIILKWNWPQDYGSIKSVRVYQQLNPFSLISSDNLSYSEYFSTDTGFSITDSSCELVQDVADLGVEDGDKIFYRIKLFTENGSSDYSNIVSGFTFSAFAPLAPANVNVSKGLYRDKIVVSWDEVVQDSEGHMAADFYRIYKRTEDSDSFTLVCDNLEELIYEYAVTDTKSVFFMISSVRVKDDLSLEEGAPGDICEGYCLRAPQFISASIYSYSDKIKLIYSLDDVIPLDNIAAVNLYRSDDSEMNNSELVVSLSSEDLNASIYFDESPVTEQNYYYSLKIESVAGEESDMSLIKKGICGEIPKPEFTVSQGSSDTIFINIVNTDIDYKAFVVERKYSYYDSQFEKKEKYADELNDLKPDNYNQFLKYKHNPNPVETSWHIVGNQVEEDIYEDDCNITIYNSLNCKITGKASYRLRFVNFDDNVKLSEYSEVKQGFRQISNEEFLHEFLSTVDRSQFKMKWLHYGGTKPAQDDDVNGDKNGYLAYRPKFGAPVKVTTSYVNYCDYFMTFNDHSAGPQLCISGWDANGTYVGGNTVSGIYSGYVLFDIVVTDGRKAGGVYRVKQDGLSEVTLPWDSNRSIIEALLNSL
jgi:fibronectin type 3 domain-containing protein